MVKETAALSAVIKAESAVGCWTATIWSQSISVPIGYGSSCDQTMPVEAQQYLATESLVTLAGKVISEIHMKPANTLCQHGEVQFFRCNRQFDSKF
jgi:hypothetical protein